MKAHIVFTHPNLQSFNGQMRNVAIQTLKELGVTVSVSDLHQMKFKAAADEEDFTSLNNEDFFDLQIEQSMALYNHSFSEDIKKRTPAFTRSGPDNISIPALVGKYARLNERIH